MKAEYADWIAVNKKVTYADCYGTCAETTLEMAAAFPELTRVRGHYYCVVWGERSHWWLTTPDGEIIDPTADQFPSKGNGVYVPWNDEDEEPTGKCPQCGELVYSGKMFCNDNCALEYKCFCMHG